MISKRTLLSLVAAVLLLPIAIVLVLGVRSLLVAMGDAAGGLALDRVNLGLGLIWVLGVIVLLLALGVNASLTDEPPEE